MKRKWKRNTVIISMLALVGSAVFLNWKYAAPADGAASVRTEGNPKILGEAELVSGNGDPESSEDAVYTGSDYFASARLTRQQARDSAIELLEKAAAEEGAAEVAATEASESIQVLAGYTLKEAQIENLVTAKGYKDCVAFLSNDSISVVVATADGTLTESDVARITDITKTETGLPASAIKIMAAN